MSASFKSFRGKKEGLRLEFKGRDSIDDARILPRAVCAMLNADGGDILVGVRDDGSVEPIADLDAARRKIHDRLVSTVAPALPHSLVIEPLSDEPVLHIQVPKPTSKTFYVVKSTEGRFFVPVRNGDRTLLLDWPEVLHRIDSSDHPNPERGQVTRNIVKESLHDWTVDANKLAPEALARWGGLFIAISAKPTTKIDRRSAVEKLAESVLLNPESIGLRPRGWHFSNLTGPIRDPGRTLRLESDRLCAGDAAAANRRLELRFDGEAELRFVTRLDGRMRFARSFAREDSTVVLHPFAISETLSSCCDLYAHLLRGLDLQVPVVWLGVTMSRTKGLRLPPYQPGAYGFDDELLWPPPQTQDDVDSVVELDSTSFLEHPHQIARRALIEIYRKFGHELDAVPFWDAKQERFVYR